MELLVFLVLHFVNVKGFLNPYQNQNIGRFPGAWDQHYHQLSDHFHETVISESTVSSLQEAEDILSRLGISCIGKLMCEIGFKSKGKLTNESSIAMQESIRILHTILMEVHHDNQLQHTLHQIVAAYQLGHSSDDPTICNHSTFQCQKSHIQSRTICGLVKPLCPILRFSCSLCRFYLSTKSCKKTCQKYEKYCGSSECNSSTMPSEPVADPRPPPLQFDDGECVNSKLLASSFVHDKWGCLKNCQLHDECHYATWSPFNLPVNHKGLCFLFQTCSNLQTSSCQDCLTSRAIARCAEVGICNEQILHSYTAIDKVECWSACKSLRDCQWFSFGVEDRVCNMYKKCYHFYYNELVVTGQKECKYDKVSAKLLVASGGGQPSRNGIHSEVIAIGTDQITSEYTTCKELPRVRYEVLRGTGGVINDEVVFCGGTNMVQNEIFKECWSLKKGSTINMNFARVDASGIAIGNKLWVAGGKDSQDEDVDSPSEHTSESIDFNGGYQVQQLQWDFSKHCVTKFNATYNIIIGGVKFPQKTLLVHSKTLEMIPGEVLTGNGRHSLACAHIRHNNGSNYVIAAGGMSEGTFTDTSEILDVENTLNGWHPGLHLPRLCQNGSMVTLPWGNEVLYVGCNEDHLTKDIFKLTWHADNLKWVTLLQKLKYPRMDAIAMFVPDSIDTDCNSTPQCNISGICIGQVLHTYNVVAIVQGVDEATCWSLCKSNDHCNWFSINPIGQMTIAVCQLFETCTEIEPNQMFKSSQVECGIAKLLVLTGFPLETGVHSEVIDIQNEELSCTDMTNAPYEIFGGTGGFIGNYKKYESDYNNVWYYILHCGGRDSNKCWSMGLNPPTLNTITMAYKRFYVSSIIINSIDGGNDMLWVIGGTGDLNSETTSELVNIDEVIPGPALPWKFSYHCSTKMNATHSVIIGGKDEPKQSLIVQTPILPRVHFDYTVGPNLIGDGRYFHACTCIRHNNGSKFVIAVGGKDDHENYLDTSETLEVADADDNQWTQGPQLPQKCSGGSMDSYEAILFGCKDENDEIDGKIYKLSWQGDQLKWLTLPQALRYPRTHTVAMWIPYSFTNCSNCWHLWQNNVVKEFQNWGEEFSIEFTLKVTTVQTALWTNIFHFTADDADNVKYGDRIPALFIHKDGYFSICSAVNDNKDFRTDQKFVYGKEHQITIMQWRNRVQKYSFEIVMDGINIQKIENTSPRSFPNVKLYASDPWYPAFGPALGNICNVKIG